VIIIGFDGVSKVQDVFKNRESNLIRLQQELSIEWDEGFVLPSPDYSSQIAVSEDFDWSQASIEANETKAFDLVTKNEDCLVDRTYGD